VTKILRDDDLKGRGNIILAIEAVELAFRAKTAGQLVAPPRQRVPFPGEGELVFTTGGVVGDGGVAGFRAYGRFEREDTSGAQVVAVWSSRTGALEGVVLGHGLAKLRMGAIGGLAIRHMAKPDSRRVALIGAGSQARAQLEAAAAVSPIREAKVFSRSEAGRHAFAASLSQALGFAVTAADTARAAVEEADLVITATTSGEPVLSAAWLRPGVHINMIGPKTTRRQELGLDVAERARVVAVDSPEQAHALDAPFFLHGSSAGARVVELADVVAGRVPGRSSPDDVTLFCSVGLAGTEVVIADALLKAQAE
jgi:ornithine cyclodeaminase